MSTLVASSLQRSPVKEISEIQPSCHNPAMVEDLFTDYFSWLLSCVRNLPETYNLRNIPIIWRKRQMYNDWGDFLAPVTLLLLRTNAQHALHRGSFPKAPRWMEHGCPYFLLSCKKRSCLFSTLVSVQLTHAAAPAKAHSPQTTHSPVPSLSDPWLSLQELDLARLCLCCNRGLSGHLVQ